MVRLPCLVSQRAKFHIGRMTWAVFTCVCLESCTWPVAIFTMDQRKGQEMCIKFCANLEKSATETLKMIQQGFGDQNLSRTQVFQWHTQFKTSRTSVDDEHTGRTTSCTSPETSFRIDVGPFTTLLRRWKLVMGHASGFCWKNWACTVSQPNLCPGSWQLTRSSSASMSALNFVSSPPTMKRSCPGSSLVMRAGFTVTTLRQSDNPPSGKAPTSPGPNKARQVKSNLKSMFITFFDIKGFVYEEFVPTGQTVNSKFYCKVLRRLHEKLRRHRPQLWREQTWLLHHDNAPSHTSFLTHQFLAKNKIAVIPHPPYSPDLAPCDFFLFPKMKLKLKGRRFDTIEEIQAELQRVLDTLTEKCFQEVFQKWRRQSDQCLHAGGNYFEVDGGR